jgi:ADP-ribose pyrophosphatase
VSESAPAARSIVFESRWCRLVAETLGDGEPYYMLETTDYVAVVARTVDGKLVLVRQHRPVIGAESVELPSGHVDPGETAEQAGRRELLEETGMVAGEMELLGVLVPDIGRLTNRMWCYFAPDVVRAENYEPESGVTAEEVTSEEALAMAGDGRMQHALNLAVLFLALTKGRLRLAAEAKT